MSTDAVSSYDELPYQSRFLAMTHPDRMAAMAILHGLDPPPVRRCRVLELGCADGGNLITMAQSLPDARLVGVDLSARQVADGKAEVEALGVGNVELRAMSLTDVDDAFGRFDYVICHGVYSWVPAPVRDKVLDVCAANLAPNGVAYVSYNTYPGWHQRGMARAMMLYHTRGIADPSSRVREARGLIDFLARSAVPQDGPYAHVLRHEAKQLEKSRDAYVFHEHLEEENHPVYFHEFVAHAAARGLRYLAPARFQISETNLPREVEQAIARLGGDRVHREQYVDFVLNRTFRHTLLCRSEVVTRDGPSPEAVRGLRLSALARPESPAPDVRSQGPEPFVSIHGDKLTVGLPLLKAALVALHQRWPLSSGFDDLYAEATAMLGSARPEGDPSSFAAYLLQAHRTNLVDLNTVDPPLAAEPGERPLAGALTRRDAGRGSRVVNLRGAPALLGELDRLILPLLDGARDRAAVVEALGRDHAAGRFQMHREGRLLTDPAETRAALASAVEESLHRLAGEALFLAH